MKQFNIFGNDFASNDADNKYTKGVGTPTYEPKNECPNLLELLDNSKSSRLIDEINNSKISDKEKAFLIEAATRHNVFNYSKIADYYANSSEEMKKLMESSALVIIDFEKAIELGYIELSDKVIQQYLEYNE